MRIGGLEAGGTKMVCAVGNEHGELYNRISLPTSSPEETVPQIAQFFRENSVDAVGIACFGPLDLNRDSVTYGSITTTPKRAWRNYNIVHSMQKELGVPVGFDTDVNGAALGEMTWGALRGVKTGMYITIGTGIGAGIITEGRLLHGMLHPEAGHMLLSRHQSDDFKGICDYHSNCFEGLASGPSIEARWSKKAELLAEQPEVWQLEAYYIGQAIVNYIMVLSPQKIVLGGGVMHQKQLLALIRNEVYRQLGGYIQTKELSDLEKYIVLPQLGENQGVLGAIQLGVEAILYHNH